MHASGLELGDVQASGLSVDLVSKANCGRVPQELIQAELMHDRGSDAQTASQVLQAEGVRLLAAGDDRAAVEAFQAGWDVAHRAGIRNTYVTPCLPWLATALRREATRLADTDAARQPPAGQPGVASRPPRAASGPQISERSPALPARVGPAGSRGPTPTPAARRYLEEEPARSPHS